MMARRWLIRGGFALLFLLIGTGVTTLISAQQSADTTIRVCIRPNGDLTIAAPDGSCKSNEKPLSWNQRGERGPQGEPGPKGDQGAPGTFAGTFRSPNGLYSISVTDSGIVLAGPNSSTILVNAAGVSVHGGTLSLTGLATTTVGGPFIRLGTCDSATARPVTRSGDLVDGTPLRVISSSFVVISC
jgi:hypothetical protein